MRALADAGFASGVVRVPAGVGRPGHNMGRLGGLSGVAYVVHRELYRRPPIKIWQVQYPTSRLTQFFHYPKNQKYIYSSDSYPQEWISQSFSLTCPTKVNFPENGSVGRPNGLENTPRGCTIHSEEVWARGEPCRPITLYFCDFLQVWG